LDSFVSVSGRVMVAIYESFVVQDFGLRNCVIE
jgi:hypothetical protein